MTEHSPDIPMVVLILGLAVAVIAAVRSLFQRISVPPIVGYIILGTAISAAYSEWHVLSSEGKGIFEFLAHVGLIALLFRIGLESNLSELIENLGSAAVIWVFNIGVSAIGGFIVAHYLLGMGIISSLFIATAFTATSVGIAIGTWRDSGQLDTRKGGLLTDIAELDDISGIVLMTILFAIVPLIHLESGQSFFSTIAASTGIVLLKLLLFGAACIAFSLLLEERITKTVRKFEEDFGLILTVTGIGFIIASAAGLLGFSLAIGAFFAGLAFSRDPSAVRIDASFNHIYKFFAPFFFVGVGLQIEISAISSAILIGSLLTVFAILFKLVGDGIPSYFKVGAAGAALIGVSMIPRAEIAMIVMQHGLSLGDWAVPPEVYAAMVVVTALTCIISPILINQMFNRFPQTKE